MNIYLCRCLNGWFLLSSLRKQGSIYAAFVWIPAFAGMTRPVLEANYGAVDGKTAKGVEIYRRPTGEERSAEPEGNRPAFSPGPERRVSIDNVSQEKGLSGSFIRPQGTSALEGISRKGEEVQRLSPRRDGSGRSADIG